MKILWNSLCLRQGRLNMMWRWVKNYQRFAFELLRLTVFGIGAVGFALIVTLLTNDSIFQVSWLIKRTFFGLWLLVSLLCFGISAGLVLLHFYFAAEGKAYYLNYLCMKKSLKDYSGLEAIEEQKDLFSFWAFAEGGDLYKEDDRDHQKYIKKAAADRDTGNFLLRNSRKTLAWAGVLLWLGAMSLVFSFITIIYNHYF